MNQVHQTLCVLRQAGRVRLDTEEIDALAYAPDAIAPCSSPSASTPVTTCGPRKI